MQAWLDTVPEKGTQRRRATWHGGEPEIGPLEHLAEWLQEVGPIQPDGMPVNWQELSAWMQSTGTDATPWEQSALIDLSMAYAAQAMASKDPSSPAPWSDPSRVNHQALAERARRRHKP